MFFKILCCMPFIVWHNSFAEAGLPSAYRNPDTPYEVYESRAKVINREDEFDTKRMVRKTPLSMARKFPEAELPRVKVWKEALLQKRFERVRDARFINHKGKQRRASWMFPDDGCFARAALANRNIFQWFYPLANKVFAFGNLKVKTKNSLRGFVTWWYHVAPIVQVKDKKFVLDPAIEPARPLELSEWLGRMGKPERIKVAICASGTYSPGDDCDKKTDGLELRAERVQRSYLTKEEHRLKRLGRNLDEALGDTPLWTE